MLKSSWIFPIVQSIHLAGIALMVGTIALSDLRLLGLVHKKVSGAWTVAGFAIMAITGPILFLADIPRYTSNPAFLVKMAILGLALAIHLTLHRKGTRAGAILSLLLWTCVVLSGRAIADFDV